MFRVAVLLLLAPTGLAAQVPPAPAACDGTPGAVTGASPPQRLAWSLIPIRCRVRAQGDSALDTAQTTLDMVEAARIEGDSLLPLLRGLAARYPDSLFPLPPAAFVDSALAHRLEWFYFISQPDGIGQSGSIWSVEFSMTRRSVIAEMIEELVLNLVAGEDDLDFSAWRDAWRRAGRSRHEVAPTTTGPR